MQTDSRFFHCVMSRYLCLLCLIVWWIARVRIGPIGEKEAEVIDPHPKKALQTRGKVTIARIEVYTLVLDFVTLGFWAE